MLNWQSKYLLLGKICFISKHNELYLQAQHCLLLNIFFLSSPLSEMEPDLPVKRSCWFWWLVLLSLITMVREMSMSLSVKNKLKIFYLSCLVGYQVAGGSENNAHLSGELRMPVLSPIGSPACSSWYLCTTWWKAFVKVVQEDTPYTKW